MSQNAKKLHGLIIWVMLLTSAAAMQVSYASYSPLHPWWVPVGRGAIALGGIGIAYLEYRKLRKLLTDIVV